MVSAKQGSKKLMMSVIAASISSAAFAQSESAGGIQAGPMTVYPSLAVSLRHDDNIFQTANETKSWLTVIAPQVKVEASSASGIKFGADLAVEDGRYKDSGNDDYTDQRYALYGELAGSSMGLKLRAEMAKLHDPRSPDSVGGLTQAKPNEYDNNSIAGVFAIGAPSSQGRIEFEAGLTDKEYTNNRAVTRTADRETTDAGVTFYWRIQPKTQLLLQAKQSEIDYDVDRPTPTTFNLDSKEQRYYAGVKWDATAKTSGTAKVGRLKKDFDAATLKDFSGGSWDIGINWAPLTYSTVQFTSSKQTSESSGTGNALLTKAHQVSWTHEWTSRIQSQLMLGRSDTEYLDAIPSREDRTTTSGIKLNYAMRYWLALAAEYTHTDRNSSQSAFDYKRNLLMFTVTARM